jgi:hypothetical protein
MIRRDLEPGGSCSAALSGRDGSAVRAFIERRQPRVGPADGNHVRSHLPGQVEGKSCEGFWSYGWQWLDAARRSSPSADRTDGQSRTQDIHMVPSAPDREGPADRSTLNPDIAEADILHHPAQRSRRWDEPVPSGAVLRAA